MNYTYDPNVDYSALMQEALASGNTQLAAVYEQQRNAKIRGEGLSGQYETTANYAQYLPSQEPSGAFAGLEQTQQAIKGIGSGPFTYDQSKDAAYQAFRKQALRETDRGTRETMGAYAAMTQGVPSTAAITAANQAGDYYRAQLADRAPEFEANAYSRWLNDQNAQMQKQQTLQNGYAQILAAENQKWQQEMTEREYALSLLASGVMPSTLQLNAAGLTQAQAQGILDSQRTTGSARGGGSDAGSGKAVEWDTRQRLGEAYKTGGIQAIASEVDYFATMGYNVDELINWIYTYYPYTPQDGYTGGAPTPTYDDRYTAP